MVQELQTKLEKGSTNVKNAAYLAIAHLAL